MYLFSHSHYFYLQFSQQVAEESPLWELTVNMQLESLGLLASLVEGQALVLPLVSQLAALDPQHLSLLQELDPGVHRDKRPEDTEDQNEA